MAIKLSAKSIKQALLEGKEVKYNKWAILINAETDDVEIYDPQGTGRAASFLYLDKAVKDFAKFAQIPEKTPKPVKYDATPGGDKVLGPDSSLDSPFNDPKINTQPETQGVKPDKGLGSDTSKDSPFTDPAINTRPLPDLGTGGLSDKDLGRDTTKNAPFTTPAINAKKKLKNAEADMTDVDGEDQGDPDTEFYPAINEKNYQIENDGETPSSMGEYFANKIAGDDEDDEDFEYKDEDSDDGLEEDLIEDLKDIGGELGELAEELEEVVEEYEEYEDSEDEEDEEDDDEEYEDEEDEDEDDEEDSAGIVDTFEEMKPQASYSELLRQAPADRLLKDIANPTRWAAARQLEAFGNDDYLDEDAQDSSDLNYDIMDEGVNPKRPGKPSMQTGKCRGKGKHAQEDSQWASVLDKSYVANIAYKEVNDMADDYGDEGSHDKVFGDAADMASIIEEGNFDEYIPGNTDPSKPWVTSDPIDPKPGDRVYELDIKNSTGSALDPNEWSIFNKVVLGELNANEVREDLEKERNTQFGDDSSYAASNKKAVSIKENWGHDGGYGRDLEAESAEELYHIVRSFGQDDDYDWTSYQPRQYQEEDAEDSGVYANKSGQADPAQMEQAIQMLQQDPNLITKILDETQVTAPTAPIAPVAPIAPIANKNAVDEAGQDYWEGYYGDYGEAMTKDDSGNKDRKDRKPVKDLKNDRSKDDATTPKVEEQPKPQNQQSVDNKIKGQAAPPAPAPAAPANDPAAPAPAPGQGAPKAPAAPPKAKTPTDPAAGDEGLKTLGWEDADIQVMTPDEKTKILQVKLNKPGTGTAPAPGGQAPGGKPPVAPPAAPAPAPAQPAAPAAPAAPAPASVRKDREIADKVKAHRAFKMLSQAAPVMEQAPAAPAPAPAAPAVAPVPDANPVKDEIADKAVNNSPEGQVMAIYQEILDQDVSASSPTEIQAKKSNELMQRAMSEAGMSPSDVKTLFGKENLMSLFPV